MFKTNRNATSEADVVQDLIVVAITARRVAFLIFNGGWPNDELRSGQDTDLLRSCYFRPQIVLPAVPH